MQRPIPFRPDPGVLAYAERKSLIRACHVIEMACRDKQNPRNPETLARTLYPGDADTLAITKAAQTPTGTDSFPGLQTMRVLPMLAPASASARLLSSVTTLDLQGISTISVPVLSTVPTAIFVGERQPAPVVQAGVGSVVLGPAKKVLILTALTNEMQAATGQTAETILSNALSAAAELAMDSVLFSSSAATVDQPSGILHGVTPGTASTAGGARAIADDCGALAKIISGSGFNTDSMIIVTTAALAQAARVLVGPKFTNLILSSPVLADGTVIGLLPQGLVTGYEGQMTIDVSTMASAHFDDSSPKQIVDLGGGVAIPVRSAFQTDTRLLRCRGWCAWAQHPGAISLLTGAAW
jgi:hypothetical protein